MQRLEKRTLIHQDITQVWNRLTTPECWLALNEAFAKWNGKLRLAQGGARLENGSEVVFASTWGKPIVRWRVVHCTPREKLELVSTGTRRISYHLTATFTLDSPGPETTVVTFTLAAIFLNQFVEILSLILPTHLLYSRRMGRVLEKLRALVE